MKYDLKKENIEHDLKWLEKPNNGLNDYGTLVRHLINEVDKLKQLLIQRVSNTEGKLSCNCPICSKQMTSQLVEHLHCKECNEHYTR